MRRETFFAAAMSCALALVAAVWVLGGIRAEADLLPSIRKVVPGAGHIVQSDSGLYTAWADAAESELVGYVVIGEAGGYGTELQTIYEMALTSSAGE